MDAQGLRNHTHRALVVSALAVSVGAYALSAAPAHAAQPRQAPPTQIIGGGTPGAVTTPAAHATPHPKKASTPAPNSEAQTPLHLTDPLATDVSAPAAPWWQTMLDVTWKLGLVVGLIYLAMRALAVLKRKGFSFTPTALTAKGGKAQRHFFEQLDEIQLAPQHALHAIRAGERIYLIARANGEMRAIGELDLTELGEEATHTSALPAGFANQLMRAWAHLTPPREASTLPALRQSHAAVDEPETDEDDIVEAQWVKIKPEPSPARVSETPDSIVDLPVRRGTARPSDAPPPADTLTPSQEREILWYAEEHGDSAAAKKFGLTRQRVTAMRNRYERKRQTSAKPAAGKPTLATVQTPPTKTPVAPTPRPTRPLADVAELTRTDHPRPEGAALAAARGSLARTAYTQGKTPAAPKAAPDADIARPTEQPAADAEDPLVTVGQILAARFGIKLPPTATK